MNDLQNAIYEVLRRKLGAPAGHAGPGDATIRAAASEVMDALRARCLPDTHMLDIGKPKPAPVLSVVRNPAE